MNAEMGNQDGAGLPSPQARPEDIHGIDHSSPCASGALESQGDAPEGQAARGTEKKGDQSVGDERDCPALQHICQKGE